MQPIEFALDLQGQFARGRDDERKRGARLIQAIAAVQ
jgi:hypothetical protein